MPPLRSTGPVPLRCFFGDCDAVPSTTVLYKTVPLTAMPPSLRSAAASFAARVRVPCGKVAAELPDTPPAVNLWFGRAGAVATFHYGTIHSVVAEAK